MLSYENCSLCARQCNADRNLKKTPCGSGPVMRIARYALHLYEEPPISGTRGSGTVFFSGCPLSCAFCQNSGISRKACGKIVSPQGLNAVFEELKNAGAHNINLVNPTHFVPSVIETLRLKKTGIPIVYNTHGYDSVNTIRELEGLIDIYLPDIKYFDNYYSLRYSKAKDYFTAASKAVKLMCGSVKNTFDENGLMKSGVIIRHLILPQLSSDSIKILEFIKNELPDGTLVSLMAQYTPYNDLGGFPEINRKITRREYDRVIDKMIQLDLKGYIQNLNSADKAYIPQWDLL